MSYEDDLAEIFEISVGEIQEELLFKSLDSWDSLTLLSLVSYLKDHFEVVISNGEINQIETLGQLQELIQNKKA